MFNRTCNSPADHDIECWIVDEDMNVLQKCSKCDWQYLDIAKKPEWLLEDFKNQKKDI